MSILLIGNNAVECALAKHLYESGIKIINFCKNKNYYLI